MKNVNYEKVIINSFLSMDIKANLRSTLKLEMLKVKVKDESHNG